LVVRSGTRQEGRENHIVKSSVNFALYQILFKRPMRDKVGRICAMHGGVTKCLQIFGLKSWKQPSRLKPGWEDKNKLDLKALGWEGVDCIHFSWKWNQRTKFMA